MPTDHGYGPPPVAGTSVTVSGNVTTVPDSTESTRLAAYDHKIVAPLWTGTTVTAVSNSNSNGVNRANIASTGLYLIMATAACRYQQGNSAVAVTTGGYYLPADTPRLMAVDNATTHGYVDVTQVSASGTVYFMPYG